MAIRPATAVHRMLLSDVAKLAFKSHFQPCARILVDAAYQRKRGTETLILLSVPHAQK